MIRRTLPIVAVIAVLGACDSTEPRVPAAVEVDQQALTVQVGDTARVEAVVIDQSGRAFDTPPDGFAITWSTSAPSVATVSDGLITGVGRGDAVIRAHAGALPAAEVAVTVESRVVTAQLGFSYSGDRTGSFSIDETFAIDEIGAGDWAVTFYAVDDGLDFTDAMGFRLRGDGLVDFMWFWVEGHITSADTRPAGALLLLGWNIPDNTAEKVYEVTSGTVTHTSVTTERMVGTFALEMAEDGTGAALTVSGGTFDLPLVEEDEVFADGAASAGPGTVILPEPVRQLRRSLQR
jgi:hypothetical protein